MGKISSSGAISVQTGKFTGRSPKDRFIVKDDITSKSVWWGDINIPFEKNKFDALYTKVANYLEKKEIYVRDVYACSLESFQLNIRAINEYPWSNHFVSNMFNEVKKSLPVDIAVCAAAVSDFKPIKKSKNKIKKDKTKLKTVELEKNKDFKYERK